MGNIVLLDELTINQIAAGEVIERPASVIKEMVENSIDAGATNITVEIKNGGISYIRVSDNGKGIAKDDVEMAFERHATSKIRSAKDLQDVKSMGFRGEALASIAAIANVELVSKTEEQETGRKIVVEGGDVLNIEEVGCSTGTVITVRNLFYNTPVRYKFLKKDYTETGYIEDVITRVALVHPEIAIKLINSGKILVQTNGNGDLKSVIYSIYGKDIATEILPVSYEYEYIKINGVIGKPVIARSNRANQIFFVNKRYIKDKTLSSAEEQAFKGMIPIGKFAFSVLNVEMEPNKVDVNVHPAKLEVRFEEESVVFKAVYHAIKNTLLSADLISDREKNKEIKEVSQNAFKIQNINTDGGLFGKTVHTANMTTNNSEYDIKDKEKESSKDSINASENADNTIKTDNINETKKVNIEEIIAEYKRRIMKQNQAQINNQELEKNSEKEGKAEEQVQVGEQEQAEEQVQVEKQEQTESQVEVGEQEQTESQVHLENQEQREKVAENFAKQLLVERIGKNKVKKMKNTHEESTKSFEEMYKKLFGTEPYSAKKHEEIKKDENIYNIKVDELSNNVSVFENMEEYQRPTYNFIGIAFKTYIILEMNDELYIMDQHAAHERILYEKVKANFYRDGEKESQMLLLPDIITLTTKEMGIAKDNFDLFEKAGFVVEEFGENTIKLSGVPPICIDLETKELFLETLDEINTVARTAKQEKEEKFLATVACKAAVKANMALTEEEVTSLMDELLKLPNPFSCPHGRPTVIKMSKYDIERKFARK